MWFMKNIFERMAKDAPELYLFYKDAHDVYEARSRQVEGEREKMQLKRLKNSRRYRCAAVTNVTIRHLPTSTKRLR